MSLEVPGNTPDPVADAAHVALRGRRAAARSSACAVFVDNNPSPLVATFEFGDPPVTQIDLRVRIDRFTSVRAVAEKADGGLEMRSAWVKASGGCSAPPSAAAGGTLGEIRLRPGEDAKSLLVSIRHPNSSGFQIDPRTGDNIPAHYVSHIRIEAGGRMLLDAETGISVSENPTLRIASDQSLPAPVTVDAVDSVTQAHFTASTRKPAHAQRRRTPRTGEWPELTEPVAPRAGLGGSCWPRSFSSSGAGDGGRARGRRACPRRVCAPRRAVAARCARPRRHRQYRLHRRRAVASPSSTRAAPCESGARYAPPSGDTRRCPSAMSSTPTCTSITCSEIGLSRTISRASSAMRRSRRRSSAAGLIS